MNTSEITSRTNPFQTMDHVGMLINDDLSSAENIKWSGSNLPTSRC